MGGRVTARTCALLALVCTLLRERGAAAAAVCGGRAALRRWVCGVVCVLHTLACGTRPHATAHRRRHLYNQSWSQGLRRRACARARCFWCAPTRDLAVSGACACCCTWPWGPAALLLQACTTHTHACFTVLCRASISTERARSRCWSGTFKPPSALFVLFVRANGAHASPAVSVSAWCARPGVVALHHVAPRSSERGVLCFFAVSSCTACHGCGHARSGPGSMAGLYIGGAGLLSCAQRPSVRCGVVMML